jgi:hypothetical protein
MNNTPGRIVLFLVFVVVAAGPALAGLVDPLPAPFTKQVFSVPGVINNGVVTVISCSSASTASLNVGVEWFRKNGTSVGVASAMIPAGETRNFASATTLALPIDGVMPGPGDTLKSGAARVLSTTTAGLLCNAFLMDPLTIRPKCSCRS